MSKVDAQRAMREARYAALQANRTSPATPTRSPDPAVAAPARQPRAKVPLAAAGQPSETVAAQPDPEAEVAELCGHRSMNGRSCTRPAGHSEKNHRYS